MKFIVVTLVAAVTLGLFPAALAAEAQQAGKVARVATLWVTTRATAQPYLDAIEEGSYRPSPGEWQADLKTRRPQ